MERIGASQPQAPDGTVTQTRDKLKQFRDEGLLVLKKYVLMSLISNPRVLPHWRKKINSDGIVAFSKKNRLALRRHRRKIIREEIIPRKDFLHMPPYEERQHRYVQGRMVEFADELGVPTDVVMRLVNRDMDKSVSDQKRIRRKRTPTTSQRQRKAA